MLLKASTLVLTVSSLTQQRNNLLNVNPGTIQLADAYFLFPMMFNHFDTV
jgi:hypothetical protein